MVIGALTLLTFAWVASLRDETSTLAPSKYFVNCATLAVGIGVAVDHFLSRELYRLVLSALANTIRCG